VAGDEDGFAMISWCLWETIEACSEDRSCSRCPLSDDCKGIARRGGGFLSVEDAIGIKSRTSRASWEAEMLCTGAHADWLVLPEFDENVHVERVEYCPDWPLYRAIDFGYRSPLVCLWIQVTPGGRVHVINEYVRHRLPLTHHAEAIRSRDPGPVRMTYVDPAGRQKESTSGRACTELLAAAGIPSAARASTIGEGLELIRAGLAPALGESTLRIHPRCRRLIDALRAYHYPPGEEGAGRPVKDGPDHCIDALRYFFVNRCRPAGAMRRGMY
jgi:hypothetical protein